MADSREPSCLRCKQLEAELAAANARARTWRRVAQFIHMAARPEAASREDDPDA